MKNYGERKDGKLKTSIYQEKTASALMKRKRREE